MLTAVGKSKLRPKEHINMRHLYLPLVLCCAFFKGYIKVGGPIFWLAILSLDGVFVTLPKKFYYKLLTNFQSGAWAFLFWRRVKENNKRGRRAGGSVPAATSATCWQPQFQENLFVIKYMNSAISNNFDPRSQY